MVEAVGHQAWLKLRNRARTFDEEKLRSLSPFLILAPHQDDETLGCGGLLAIATGLGLRPRVAYLTDGAASHLGSLDWTPYKLAMTRRQEAIDALRVLGVPAEDILFLGWPDASPFRPREEGYRLTLDKLLRWSAAFKPRSIWAPWRGENHCDHVAAAIIAGDLARLPGFDLTRMEYLVWGWSQPSLSSSTDRVWALACAGTTTRRRRALACHRTQTTGMISDARTSFQIPSELAALTGRPVEIYLEER